MNHSIKIILANNETDNSSINKAANHTTLKTPALSLIKDTIKWNEIEGAKAYKIISNGKQIKTTKSDFYVVNESGFNEFTVIALDSTKTESFAAEPISFAGKEKVNIIEIENSTAKANYPYKGFSGDGFVETSTTINASIQIPINISVAGFYSIDIKYANGNGPTNTENKCAIRTAQVDNKKAGIFVLPQRGKDEWSNWGFSNAVQTYFTAGKHILTIKLEPFNENMNGEINQAMLDYLRITKLK